MDSVLEKMGLYDFFGVFISGMMIMIGNEYLGISTISSIDILGNDFVYILSFLLISYFLGLVIQEISSYLDKKVFKFRENARSNFLNENNHIVENKKELLDYQTIANRFLKVNNKEFYTKEECEYVYYKCKSYLDVLGENDKVNRINSLYGMSRSFMIALPITIVIYLYLNGETTNVFMIIGLSALIFLFYKRCKRFSEYKVRIILRHYSQLKKR